MKQILSATQRKILGERIEFYRNLQDLTQEQLALSAGIGESMLSQIENGHKPTSVAVITKIAKRLRIAPAVLLACDNCDESDLKCAENFHRVQQHKDKYPEVYAHIKQYLKFALKDR